MTPPTRRFVKRKGLVLSYEVRGAGPVVVLVQGLAFPGAMWLTLPKTLVEMGFTVVTPDNRGSGQSAKPWRPWTMRTMADDLAAVIADLGARGPVLVVGISLGGMIAQQLAVHHPQLVRGLVLAATTCGLPGLRPPRLAHLVTLLRASLGTTGLDEALHRTLVHPESRRRWPNLFDDWDRVLAREGRSVVGTAGQLLAVLTHHVYFGLSRVRCPTVVMAGDSDLLIPPGNSKVVARRIRGATLEIIAQAGHAFPLEVPDALPRAVRQIA